ncbi:MAG: hypothetical protein IMW91_03100 [Firmicutes bacterium]|nr:hypothetical protein [Bacillota bacterium]
MDREQLRQQILERTLHLAEENTRDPQETVDTLDDICNLAQQLEWQTTLELARMYYASGGRFGLPLPGKWPADLPLDSDSKSSVK